jgi:hypothetical protein
MQRAAVGASDPRAASCMSPRGAGWYVRAELRRRRGAKSYAVYLMAGVWGFLCGELMDLWFL